ncbi:MAG: hypothetical protein J5654_01305 [Victivallales bacterium]|nr:hypothetical protein [Victivallales bacterium]
MGIILCLIITAIYAPSLNAPFLVNWDDGAFILNNPQMEWTWENAKYYLSHPYQNLYTPTPMLSLMADKAVFNNHPFGYRFHNLGAHILAALILFAILRKLRVPPWGAFFGALLWAIHPQRVESVCWIVERKDLACALFGSLAVYCFLIGRDAKRPWLWQLLAVLAAFISLGGKPASAALPGIFLLLAYALDHGDWQHIAKDVTIPAIGSFLAVLFVIFMTKQDNSGQFETRFFVIAHNLGWYPVTALLPWPPLNPIYPAIRGWGEALPWLFGGLVLAVAILLLAYKVHRHWAPGIIAILLVGGTMLPVLGLLRYTDFDYCDRYNHIVSMVLWGSLTVLFGKTLLEGRSRRLGMALLTVLALAEGMTTLFYHQTVWQSDDALAIYCLTRPGEPNLKALELGLTTGCSHASPNLLLATAKAYQDYPELQMVDGKEVPADLRNLISWSLVAHANFLMDNRKDASPLLALVEEYLEPAAQQSFSMHYLAEFLYRDLAAIAADRRDKDAALHYLEMEAKYLPPNPDHPATKQNRFLRERLAE